MPLGLSSVHVLSAPLLEMSALNLRAGENRHLDASLRGIFLFLHLFLP